MRRFTSLSKTRFFGWPRQGIRNIVTRAKSDLGVLNETNMAPWNTGHVGTGAKDIKNAADTTSVSGRHMTDAEVEKWKNSNMVTNHFKLGLVDVSVVSSSNHNFKQWMPFIDWNSEWQYCYPRRTSFKCKVTDVPKVIREMKAHGYLHRK